MKEEVSMLLEPARAFLLQVGQFLPKLLLALIVVVVGWLLAKAVRFAVSRGLRAITVRIDSLIEPKCTGMCGALAIKAPEASNSAQLKSSRSLMLTECAVF